MFTIKQIQKLSILILLTGLLIISCGKKNDRIENKLVDKVTKDSVVIQMAGVDSLNALEVLKLSHDVNEVSSAMGAFVKGIDGVENNMSVFWFFEINGKMANKAADKIMTTPSDTIIWYFRQPGSEKSTEKNDTL